MSAVQLIDRIHATQARGATKLIAIGGRGGSGKTTLAQALAGIDPSLRVVHLDDLCLPRAMRVDGEVVDWPTVDRFVCALADGRPARYRRIDWDRDELAEEHVVPAGGTVVLEGVAPYHDRVADRWDLKIWLERDETEAYRRGLARDGEHLRSFWEDEWLPAERRYVAEQRPMERADLVIDTNDQSS